MEFKKKLKVRLYVGVAYIAVGILMIIGAIVTKTENSFLSSLGLVAAVMGLVRIRNYRIITKDEQSIRKQEIAETDERNLVIWNKARSAAFSAYLFLSGAAVIVLSLFEMHDAAKWISLSVLTLVAVYWICYWIYRKKL